MDENITKEIAKKLVSVNNKQAARWSGLSGEEFKEVTREAIEELVEVEILLEDNGFTVGILHTEGTVFNRAYCGTMLCGKEDSPLTKVEGWVRAELANLPKTVKT